jgi:hypothetical protein
MFLCCTFQFLNFIARELRIIKHEDPVSCIRLLKLYSWRFGMVINSPLYKYPRNLTKEAKINRPVLSSLI